MAFKKKKNKNEIFLRCKTKTEKKSSTIGPRKPREKKKNHKSEPKRAASNTENSATRIQPPEKEIENRDNRRGNVTQELWLSSSGGVRTVEGGSQQQQHGTKSERKERDGPGDSG